MRTAAEILKSAIEHEVKACVFYSKAAEFTENDESRMVFLELSDMEDDHAKELVHWVKKSPFHAEFDAEKYLRILEQDAEKSVTLKETDILKNGDMKAVLELALSLEQSAAKNYEELMQRHSDPAVHTYCKKLMDEEKKHAEIITRLIDSVGMDAEDRPGL